jgi:hypothetical protein
VNTKTFWALLLERALKTALQAAVALLIAAGPLDLLSAPWVDAVAAGGMAALLSMLTTLVTTGAPALPSWAVPIYKALATGVQTFIATAIAGGWGLLDTPWRATLLASATAAVTSLLTSIASAPFGPPGSSVVVAEAA